MNTLEEKEDIFDRTGKSILQNESVLTSGCKEIDSALRGGFSRRGITQIYGQAGTGKTQFALQLCLTVQIPVKPKAEPLSAIYICTEAHFPTNRLQELLQKSQIAKKHYVSGDMIFVEHVSIMEQLEECICQKVPCLLQHRKVGLLVIDSIAAPYRVEFDQKDLKSRAKHLRKIGEQLHSISKKYNISVICINQVSAAISTSLIGKSDFEDQPSLGIVWANLITNSFYLYKKNGQRYMYFINSPYLSRSSIKFEVRDTGVVGIQ